MPSWAHLHWPSDSTGCSYSHCALWRGCKHRVGGRRMEPQQEPPAEGRWSPWHLSPLSWAPLFAFPSLSSYSHRFPLPTPTADLMLPKPTRCWLEQEPADGAPLGLSKSAKAFLSDRVCASVTQEQRWQRWPLSSSSRQAVSVHL